MAQNKNTQAAQTTAREAEVKVTLRAKSIKFATQAKGDIAKWFKA